MPKLLVLGASSDIAKATALEFAKNGFSVCLAARNIEALELEAKNIQIRSQQEIEIKYFDALQIENIPSFWNSFMPKPDVVLCAIGLLGSQEQAQIDIQEAELIMRTNYNSLVPILALIANDFEKLGSGTIIGISSVAGDRGRASNYIYGSAKAGFTAFLSGLRARLANNGVNVITIKPGFVATKMTEKMNLSPLLTATPEQVARDIYKAYLRKRNVVYTKWIWRYIMLAIKIMPEMIFKKIKF